MHPGFSKPVPWARARWFFPEIEMWLLAYHGIPGPNNPFSFMQPAGSKGKTFGEWQARSEPRSAAEKALRLICRRR
jgi:hypothetical protein